MACVRLLTNPRASRLGRYPSLPAIVVTRSRTSTVILGSFFKARETVAAEMPNAPAMSLMVTLLEMEANGGFTGENSESHHNLCKRLHKNGSNEVLYRSFVQGG